MYYLSTGLQQGTKYPQFQSLATVSEDFIHYKDQPIKIDESNPVEQELYFALGVYQDKDGKYRSCYGGKGNKGFSGKACIRVATPIFSTTRIPTVITAW